LDDWTLQAEFTLYFVNKDSGQGDKTWQTRVRTTRARGREYDKEEEPFEGFEPHPWVNWILQQAALPVDTVTPNPAQVSIRGVEIEPQSLSDVHDSKFVSAIRFTVSGANAKTLTADNPPYQIIVHAVDSGSGITKHVASVCSQLKTGQSEYVQRLGLPIPNLRRYELQTIVLIQSQPELMAIYRGPTINVTP